MEYHEGPNDGGRRYVEEPVGIGGWLGGFVAWLLLGVLVSILQLANLMTRPGIEPPLAAWQGLI